VPRTHRPVLRRVGTLGLRLLGWRVRGELPDVAKFIIIVAPHTSNWDFAVGFLAYLALELDASWFGKASIFAWPFGPILRRFGGLPIRRGASENVVDRSIAESRMRSRFVLALAPEGTRRRVRTWRSGFYYIALGAGLPIVTVALDFAKREIEVGPAFQATGDYAADIARLLERFERVAGKHPALYGQASS
jgi:1-acyl-sn-glycerol-3-phosphate acyltransferase